jgi:glycine C-acetyltransferase
VSTNNKLDFAFEELESLREQGLLKVIRTIGSPIGNEIIVDGKKVLNFCSNNYLGLANNPSLKKAAIEAIESYGVGPAAVRSIAGTMDLHLDLEKKLAEFKKAEAVISLQGGLIANIAAIPVLVGEGDIIFSDELNHASIIDGCRLTKAEVIRFGHSDMAGLEAKLKEHSSARRKLIISDGVFSMDGDIAKLPEIVALSEKYNALTYIDDAHGEGVLGKGGRGIVDHFKLHGRVDVEIGTMSKAFGVVGGYVAGKKVLVDLLRQKARPFLFSSATTPGDVAACLKAVELLQDSESLVKTLWENATYFKEGMTKLGFDIGHSETPIVPVMLGDVKVAVDFSKRLFEEGIFAVAIGYPTVAMGKARIRVMISAAHTKDDLDRCLAAFGKVGKDFNLI